MAWNPFKKSKRHIYLTQLRRGFDVYVKSSGADKSGFGIEQLSQDTLLIDDLRVFYFALDAADKQDFSNAICDALRGLSSDHPGFATIVASLSYVAGITNSFSATEVLLGLLTQTRLSAPREAYDREAAAYALDALDAFSASSRSKEACDAMARLYTQTALRRELPTIFFLNRSQRSPESWPEALVDLHRSPLAHSIQSNLTGFAAIIRNLENRIGLPKIGYGLQDLYRQEPALFKLVLNSRFDPYQSDLAIGDIAWLDDSKQQSLVDAGTEYFIGRNDPGTDDFPSDPSCIVPVDMSRIEKQQVRSGLSDILFGASKQLQMA